MPTPPRILVVRFSSIGDILLTTPLLRAMRGAYPDAHLAFLTKRQYAPLVADNPRLSEVIQLGPGQSLAQVAREIRSRRFSHILDLHGNLRTRMLRFLVPGRWSGYRNHRLAREVLIRFKRDIYPRRIPVPERYFDAAHAFGLVPDGAPPEFHLSSAARAEADDWLRAAGLGGERALVTLAPGAAHATKRWPMERWRDLAGRLAQRGFDIGLVGGPEDRELADGITAGRPPIGNAAGRLSLQGTGALLARARALVSGDTGVMHMATGVGTPVVAIFGPTVRAFGFFPYARRAEVVQQTLECRPCTAWGTERCPLGHLRCLVDIQADDVDSALNRVLA